MTTAACRWFATLLLLGSSVSARAKPGEIDIDALLLLGGAHPATFEVTGVPY